MTNYSSDETGKLAMFQCPICPRAKMESKYNSTRHLLEHLSDKSYHPYKCPVEGCGVSSVRPDVVQAHVVSVHKLEWNAELVRCLVPE